ncbi:MAG: hypothetical protein R3A52_03595 [Polyangiales bacterium]
MDEPRLFPSARLDQPPLLRPGQGISIALLPLLPGAMLAMGERVLAVVVLCVHAALLVGFGRWQRRVDGALPGRVAASRAGLFLHDRLAIPRADIARAVPVHDAQGWGVMLHHRRGLNYRVQLDDAAQCRDLIETLQLDPARSAATFVVDSPLSLRTPAWIAWGFAVAIVLNNVLAARGIVPFAVVFAVLLTWTLVTALTMGLPARATVGLDGVVIDWCGRRTRIPLRDIVGVRGEPERVCLDLRDGRVVELGLRFAPARFSDDLNGHRSRLAWSRAITERVNAARQVDADARADATPAALLPSGRSTDAWLADLASLSGTAAGYRDASLDADALWRAVEGARVEPVARVAAAAALAGSLDDDGRTRVRIAADAAAEPAVREGLTAVAEGSTRRLRAAMRKAADEG